MASGWDKNPSDYGGPKDPRWLETIAVILGIVLLLS